MLSTVLALAAVGTLVSAAPVAQRGQPAGWATGYLEDYSVYHSRYLALDCQDQHNTSFFESCCHPLLATESLDSRPANCTPTEEQYSALSASATSTSVRVAGQTAAPTTTNSVEVDVATEYQAAAASSSAAPAASSSVAAQNDYATPSSKAKTSSTKTSTAAAQTSTASSSGNSGSSYSGYATYFYQGGNAGACGTVHSDSDYVIAIQSSWYGNSGSTSQYCGKQIHLTNTNNGKSVTATVADECPSCVSSDSLDLSVGAFTAIASESDGMVPITWYFV